MIEQTEARPAPLTTEQVAQWEQEGYLIVRQLIPPHHIQNLLAMYDRVTNRLIGKLKSEGLIEDERPDLSVHTRFAEVAAPHAARFGRSWRKLVGWQELFELQGEPALVDCIAQLTKTDVIGHPVFNGRPKLPDQQLTVVPWHQDSAYFGPETTNSLIIACWVPLVATDENNGCMQVAAGSHRIGLIDHHVEDREGAFLELKDELLNSFKIVSCPMQPGDVLLMHNLLFHRSLPNHSDHIRWSVDLRYYRDGDDPSHNYWADPSQKWVIRSQSQPITILPEWQQWVKALQW